MKVENKNRERILQEYNHLLSHYKHIPQEQINNWILKLIFSQTKHVSELIVKFVCEGFYRGRTHNSLEGTTKNDELHHFTCESEFWNPPSDLCTRLGRCNDLGETILYCSTEFTTAVVESRPKKDDFLTIATFKRRKPDQYKGARVKYVGLESLLKVPTLRQIIGEREHDKEKTELDSTLDELFHKNVTNETLDLYRLSIAVTKAMMKTIYDPEQGVFYEIHGMLYPSIERKNKYFNIVFRPDHARLHFGIARVSTFEVLESNDKKITLKERRIGKMKPTVILDPLDFYGINWEDSPDQKIIEIET